MDEERARTIQELQRRFNSLHPEAPDVRLSTGTLENGNRLLEIRREFQDKVSALRVYLQEYRGRPIVEVSVWNRDSEGHWWITPRHCKIREYELLRVIEVLMKAARILDGHEQPDWE